MLTFVVLLLLILIIIPALVVIPQTFTSLNYFTFPIPKFSFKWVERFFENQEWVIGLGRSLFIALVVALLATALGTMAAVAINKLEFKGKGLFMGLMISPMAIPVVIIGIALYNTFAKIGLTNTCLGLILSHTLIALPMVFTTMLSGFAGVNENLELAAMSMGSTAVGAFFKVTLPTVKSSFVASILFAFVSSLDEVAVTLFVSGANTKTLPIVMWERMNTYADPTLAVAATFLIVLTLGTYIVKEIMEVRAARKG